MISIISASAKHGYSGYDHLIVGNEADDAIGMEFRDWRTAARTINRIYNEHADRRVSGCPIRVTARVGRYGDLIERDV